MTEFREFVLPSGTKIFLGKNAENNDKLVKRYKGKENTILHTEKPGSPFCVIDKIDYSKEDLIKSAIICALKSQDWRDNKKDVNIHQFSGKDVYKEGKMKEGLWGIKKKPKLIKVKKQDIEKEINK